MRKAVAPHDLHGVKVTVALTCDVPSVAATTTEMEISGAPAHLILNPVVDTIIRRLPWIGELTIAAWDFESCRMPDHRFQEVRAAIRFFNDGLRNPYLM